MEKTMKIRNINCPNCGSNITISGGGFHKCSFCSHELYTEEKNNGNIIVNTTSNRYTNAHTKKGKTPVNRILKAFFILTMLFVVFTLVFFTLLFSETGINSPQKNAFKKPFNESVQSNQMIRFVEIAFQKKFNEIQSSDYERVKMIKFNYKDRNDGDFQIEYQLEDGIIRAVRVPRAVALVRRGR